MHFACPVDPFGCLISRELVLLSFGTLHYNVSIKKLCMDFRWSSRGVSCLQGKLAPIVHSLYGHIFWAMAASQWMLLGVESSCHPSQLWWSPARSQPCSYKVTTTWSLDYQSALGQTPPWGTLPSHYEMHLTDGRLQCRVLLYGERCCASSTPDPHFGRTIQLPHHVHGDVQPAMTCSLATWSARELLM